jgi:MoaA/NifB/PqqE/SkfB family radical SAM enzyme
MSFKDTKVALALCLSQTPDASRLRSLSSLGAGLARTFHPNSALFWKHDPDRARSLTNLITAALFEDQRIYLDYLCLLDHHAIPSTHLIAKTLDLSFSKGLDAVHFVSGGGPGQMILASTHRLREMARSHDRSQWLGDEGGTAFVALTQKLIPGYCKENRLTLNFGSFLQSGQDGPLRLPSTVDFFPITSDFLPRKKVPRPKPAPEPSGAQVDESTPASFTSANGYPCAREPKTTLRSLTRRAVLYVGFRCNIKCIFCYYAFNGDNKWKALGECKREATIYKSKYSNNCVDITGGEPTIYPEIDSLISHCGSIGLRPSVITNGIALGSRTKLNKLLDAGTHDFLISVHAIGDTYNEMTCNNSGWEKLSTAIGLLNKTGTRWRANCTITNKNCNQLHEVARLVVENGALAINFISYNPFYEWEEKLAIDFQGKHSDISRHLLEALDYCDSQGIEANVRYMPYCQLKGHEEKCYNYQQLSYDSHEWDFCSWFSEDVDNPSSKMPDYLRQLAESEEQLHQFYADKTRQMSYKKGDKCATCSLFSVCDGFTNQYRRKFGTGEAAPYDGPAITDPLHFIRRQEKIIDG